MLGNSLRIGTGSEVRGMGKKVYGVGQRATGDGQNLQNKYIIHWPEAGMVYKNRDKLITIVRVSWCTFLKVKVEYNPNVFFYF